MSWSERARSEPTRESVTQVKKLLYRSRRFTSWLPEVLLG